MTIEKSNEKAELSEMIHPDRDGFKEKVTPKKIDEAKLFIYKCECGGQHFRHAGYARIMMPFIETGGEKRMTCDPFQVMVCVSCKRSSIWVNGQMYDVTDRIDLQAWEKTEKEAMAATGPGGQC